MSEPVRLDRRPPFSGRRRVSAEDLTYLELREMLARRELEPGGQLSEEALAAQLGVSRTPLRQALTRLRFEGLVDRSANGRLHATPISAADARNLFAVRISLETLALEQAFERMTEEVLRELRALLAQMSALDRLGGTEVGRYGGQFHATLYQAGGNDLNLMLLSMLQGRIDRYRFLSTGTGVQRQRQAVREHSEILQALTDHDLPAAKRALGEHLCQARESVLAAVQSKPAAVLVDPG